jgi:glycosyltransferase involved in cell wall biosynthesis
MTASHGKPLISLLLLTYNHEKFVAEALDSVLSQTYSPLEIVIIDDCSSDRTAEIVMARLAEHRDGSNIRFVRNARNTFGRGSIETGLNMTSGGFLLIISGDDVMLPEMVEDMARVWINEDVSLVTANAFYIDEHSRSLNRTFRDPNTRGDDSFETLARDGGNACCFGAAMGFEREIHARFGWPPIHLGAFDIMFPYYAYLLKGARFIEKPLLKYRVHSGNTSLSLIEETADEMGQLLTRERIFYQHIAHALLMQEILSRLSVERPGRYVDVAKRIDPLLTIQTVEMAKKLVRTRIELQQAGVKLGYNQFGALPAAPKAPPNA